MACCVRDIAFPPRLKIVVILCGMNNINKDPPYDIAQGLIAIGSSFKNRCNNPNVFICGLLPRNEYVSFKGTTKSYRKIIFASTTKIGENTTNILHCYFSS